MQTSHSQYMTDRLAGMLVYGKVSVPAMVINKSATVALANGKFVCRGANDEKATLPASSGNVTATGFGFVCRDPGRMPNISTAEYAANAEVPIMQQGEIMAICEDTNITFGGPVYVRITTDTDGSDLGNVRADSDGGKAIALPGARFTETKTVSVIGTPVKVSFVTGAGVTGATGPTGATGATGPTGP